MPLCDNHAGNDVTLRQGIVVLNVKGHRRVGADVDQGLSSLEESGSCRNDNTDNNENEKSMEVIHFQLSVTK